MTIRNVRVSPLACRDCWRVLDRDEVVYVSSLWPYVSGHGPYGARVSCEPCERRKDATFADRSYWPARPCRVCERPTRLYRSRSREPRICCCSSPCLNAYLRERQRQRRPLISPRDCASCQQPFKPKQRRGIYCSSRCRQQAFRDRQQHG
jgi:hypothetical protein